MVTESPRLGAGVFRRLVHVIDPGAYVIDFRGVRLHVARCGAVAVPIVGLVPPCWAWCAGCRENGPRFN